MEVYFTTNQKIQLIKEIRTIFGGGLKEAKDIVEQGCSPSPRALEALCRIVDNGAISGGVHLTVSPGSGKHLLKLYYNEEHEGAGIPFNPVVRPAAPPFDMRIIDDLEAKLTLCFGNEMKSLNGKIEALDSLRMITERYLTAQIEALTKRLEACENAGMPIEGAW